MSKYLTVKNLLTYIAFMQNIVSYVFIREVNFNPGFNSVRYYLSIHLTRMCYSILVQVIAFRNKKAICV